MTLSFVRRGVAAMAIAAMALAGMSALPGAAPNAEASGVIILAPGIETSPGGVIQTRQ